MCKHFILNSVPGKELSRVTGQKQYTIVIKVCTRQTLTSRRWPTAYSDFRLRAAGEQRQHGDVVSNHLISKVSNQLSSKIHLILFAPCVLVPAIATHPRSHSKIPDPPVT